MARRFSTKEVVFMPFIQVTMLRRLTDATAEALGGDPARIRVTLYEVTGDDWGIGGEPVSQIRPQP